MAKAGHVSQNARIKSSVVNLNSYKKRAPKYKWLKSNGELGIGSWKLCSEFFHVIITRVFRTPVFTPFISCILPPFCKITFNVRSILFRLWVGEGGNISVLGFLRMSQILFPVWVFLRLKIFSFDVFPCNSPSYFLPFLYYSLLKLPWKKDQSARFTINLLCTVGFRLFLPVYVGRGGGRSARVPGFVGMFRC